LIISRVVAEPPVAMIIALAFTSTRSPDLPSATTLTMSSPSLISFVTGASRASENPVRA
jgi:hypothetical protein